MEKYIPSQQTLDSVLASPAIKWTGVSLIVGLGVVGGWRTIERIQSSRRLRAAQAADPSLLSKHTVFESFTTPSGFTYPRIRVFHKPHVNADKLPKNVPLLVFVHGLGGSASQFNSLLTNLINLAPCLAIDLPGSGLSELAPSNTKAYTTHALAELVATVISRFRDTENAQTVVFVGHSYGCALAALLASSTSPLHHLLRDHIIGMIAICPVAQAFTPKQASKIRWLTLTPSPMFDLVRLLDRWGGTNSASVARVLGDSADEETRRLQMRFNMQSESATFQRTIGGAVGSTGVPGKEVWSGMKVPLFLVAGDSDRITPAQEAETITSWLTSSPKVEGVVSPNPQDEERPRTDSGAFIQDEDTESKHDFALKTTVFPAPASHGLLYTSSTVRVLSGMIENFLANHVDKRLGASWQLQHLTTSGKWDVKNLKKWQAVEACSTPIGGIFRAMKTMREVDPEHSPKEFVKHYSAQAKPDGVAVVIDISHETPVYHPKGLEDAGVLYHKFPTVSKEKPKAEEVDHFIALVERLRKEQKIMGDQSTAAASTPHPTIGVHCHYGFNRTGFFIVCYLVEREGYKLQDAIQEFGEKRPPGIRHEHFVNELYVRYAVQMERRGTVVGS